jgi:pimeloyl-ACP methyl ester carboxylesterase
MTTLVIVAACIVAAVVVTRLGVVLIEWAHPPAGRFVDIRGQRQHVVELGMGRGEAALPIVLIHGASCNLEDMRLALGERLAVQRRVIMVDRPGLGWSERPARQGSSPAYQAQVLRDVLDRLGVDRAIVVGHSWGGALALTFALDYPERVANLILLAPPTHPWQRRLTWFYDLVSTPFAGWLFAHTLALPFGAMLLGPALTSVSLPQTPPRHYVRRAASLLVLRPAQFLANAHDLSHLKAFLARQVARYSTLAPPTVIITGDRDNTVSAKIHSMALAAAVPHAKLIVLPGIGHMLQHAAADRIVAEIDAIAGSKIG